MGGGYVVSTSPVRKTLHASQDKWTNIWKYLFYRVCLRNVFERIEEVVSHAAATNHLLGNQLLPIWLGTWPIRSPAGPASTSACWSTSQRMWVAKLLQGNRGYKSLFSVTGGIWGTSENKSSHSNSNYAEPIWMIVILHHAWICMVSAVTWHYLTWTNQKSA